MTTHTQLLGDYVQTNRKKLGLTQYQMVHLTGVSISSIANIEKGRRADLSDAVKVLYGMRLTLLDFASYVDKEAKNGNYTRE